MVYDYIMDKDVTCRIKTTQQRGKEMELYRKKVFICSYNWTSIPTRWNGNDKPQNHYKSNNNTVKEQGSYSSTLKDICA